MVQALPVQPTGMLARQQTMANQQQASSVNVQPRFFFGLKGDVKNNVIFLDDNVVCYPCGHNVVVYYMTSKMQRFIPGIEGS